MINEEKDQTIENNVDEKEDHVIEESVNDIGIVVNCIKLNVRKEPNKASKAVKIIDALTEVEVVTKESTYNFYKVILPSGVEGYCMKKFIELKS